MSATAFTTVHRSEAIECETPLQGSVPPPTPQALA
jgi:hypothetical protein